jgi:hypothetical protein
MSAQSKSINPGKAARDSTPRGARPTERAFVVQFDPIGDGRSRLRGRAELVASGEAVRFRSAKQLVDFMVSTLRKRAAVEPPS